MSAVPLITGVRDIADQYDAFILDIFGVIHNGLRPFPGTIQCLEEMQRAGKQVCLLSNSPRRARSAVDQCVRMGIPKELLGHAVTSGEATYHALEDHMREYGRHCYFLGAEFVRHLIDGVDIIATENVDEADFILNAIPGTGKSAKEKITRDFDKAITRNLPMICANPDLVVNIGDVQEECAGTFALMYEQRGGHVTYYGKPYAPVYESALEKLGMPPKSRICAIGDSLHTDIQGANGFGIDSIFNLVGIHWEEVRLDHAPGKADSDKIRLMIDAQPHRPTYVMGGFEW